jgi:hypothetical protein
LRGWKGFCGTPYQIRTLPGVFTALAADFIDDVPPSPPPAPDYAPALDLSAFSPADRRLVQQALEIIPLYTAAERRFGETMAKLIPLYLDEPEMTAGEPEVIGFGEPDPRP